MKKVIFIIAISMGLTGSIIAQDQDTQFKTLFKQDGKTTVSGFGGLMMEFTGIPGNGCKCNPI